MATIVPTITTDDPAMYQQRLDEFLSFASRIHVDITDGDFAPSHTLNLNQLYWPAADQRQCAIDLHLMMRRPLNWLDQIVSLTPDRVIMHAESDDADAVLPKIFEHLRRFNISVGVALLPDTSVDSAAKLIELADAVLVFGGHLGYQGGVADLSQLAKVGEIRNLNSSIIIEWDGGANAANVQQITMVGVDQINVGGAISSAPDARAAYDSLVGALGQG